MTSQNGPLPMAVRGALRTFTCALSLSMLFSWLCAPALAASQLSGVRVTGSRGGGVRIVLSFVGGVPQGWHVTGTGSTQITVILPGTTQRSNMNPGPYNGVNNLQAVAINGVGSELDVVLSLSQPAQVSTNGSGNAIIVDIGPAKRTPTASPPPALGPTLGPPPSQTPTIGQPYVVVPLKYADVSEVVGILVNGQSIPPNDTFAPEPSIFSLPSTGTGGVQIGQAAPAGAFGAGQQGTQQNSFGQRITDNIAVDRRLNAIILSGTPQQIASLKAQIAAIDVPVPSVMLECEVVELSATAARDLGLDFTGGSGGPIVSGGYSFPSTGTSPFSTTIKAQLFASIANGGGRILDSPRVLALNGTPAQILSGDALPIISTTLYPGSPPVSQTTVSYVAVGVDLQIQPRISQDGFITSHIFAEVSSVTAYLQTTSGPIPQISLRQATTSATVADNQPFIIGGLLRDEEIQNMSKIPILGDLPIIGGLFRTRHDTLQRSNLYVIITPRVVGGPGYPTNQNSKYQQLPKPQVPGPMPFPTPTPAATAHP